MKSLLMLLVLILQVNVIAAPNREKSQCASDIIELGRSYAVTDFRNYTELFEKYDVGAILKLSEEEFAERLERFGISQAYFYEHVVAIEQGKRVKKNFFQGLIDAKNFRNIYNDAFFKTYLTETTLSLSIFTATHFKNFGMERTFEFILQFGAIMFTEMALVFANADHAAKKVALKRYDVVMDKFEEELIEQGLEEKFNIRQALNYSKEVVSSTWSHSKKSFKEVALAAGTYGSLPFFAPILMNPSSYDSHMQGALVAMTFHTAFVATSSNIRAAFLYGKIYPDLTRSMKDDVILQGMIYWGFLALNAYVGAEMYTQWKPHFEEFIADQLSK